MLIIRYLTPRMLPTHYQYMTFKKILPLQEIIFDYDYYRLY